MPGKKIQNSYKQIYLIVKTRIMDIQETRNFIYNIYMSDNVDTNHYEFFSKAYLQI